MNRTARIQIDLSAIEHNYRLVKSHLNQGELMAVVKANAYGHGLEPVANALSIADGFAVSCVQEALAVRAVNQRAKILVLQGAKNQKEFELCSAHNLDCVLHQSAHLDGVAALGNAPINVWIKLDTGMHRLGFSPDDVPEVFETLKVLPCVKNINLMTHCSDADDVSLENTENQLAEFYNVVKRMRHDFDWGGMCSVANSGAVLAWSKSHADWQRLGIALYGVSPFVVDLDASHSVHKLKPAMTFMSQVIAVNQYDAGARIGYGGTWVCKQKTRIAVVAVGYGDGYPRCASAASDDSDPKQAHVWIRGVRCPVIGRVSMDMITVDASQCPNVCLGDDVELWGACIRVEEVAHSANTIAYDLLCGVFGRVQYEYI